MGKFYEFLQHKGIRGIPLVTLKQQKLDKNNKLIKFDGSLIKEGDIRRRDVSREIAKEIIKENK